MLHGYQVVKCGFESEFLTPETSKPLCFSVTTWLMEKP